MNTPQWMIAQQDRPVAPSGRRAKSRRPSLTTVLGALVVLAWGWGVYELTLLFLK